MSQSGFPPHRRTFDELMAEVMATAARFGHREHTHLTWLFANHHAALVDKRLLTRFYRPATLASAQARTGWVEPDLAPFPWQATDR